MAMLLGPVAPTVLQLQGNPFAFALPGSAMQLPLVL